MDDVRYYEDQYPGRGQRFAEVDRLLTQIELAPPSFPILTESGIRSAKVPRFPYCIVFVEIGAHIEVLAIAHAKRPPVYWRHQRK